SSAGAQDNAIEEIIVTAQKRTESVQDIGLSISAFDAEQLAAAGITDVSRLSFLVAGLTYATAGNDAKFNVRGANSTQTFADNASIVGAFVDGVYKPHASQQTRAFFDVERLEFLKGPQGTLYGRNTFAGALNLYTNKPHTERIEGGISASYERFDTLRTEGFINLPLNDTWALRLAGYSENGDGYLDNNAGPNGGAPDNLGVRFGALWVPNDDVEVLFRYTYIEEKGTTAGLFGYKHICRTVDAQGITDAFGAFTDCQNPLPGSSAVPRGDIDEYDISQEFLPDGDLFEHTYALEINWDAGPVLLKSITAYTDYENNIPNDFDFSPTAYNIGGFDDHLESFSQEIVLSSNYDSAFQWTAGAYYAKDESFWSFWIFNQTVADNSVRPIVDTEFGPFVIFNGTPLVSTETNLGGAFADSQWVDTTAMAVFFQGEFSVSDNLRLIAGLRYNDEEKDMDGGGSNFTANGPVTQIFISGSAPAIIPSKRTEAFAFNRNAPGANTSSFDYDNTSWTASIVYDLSGDMMLYATASTGFLSGALNNGGTATDEQESEMVEIGFKSILMDGTLLLNVAAHYTEYTNLLAQFQTLFVDPDTGVETVLTTSINGGDIEATGLELEIQYLPTDEWSLGGTVAWLDAEFGEFGQTSPYQFNRGVPTEFESVDGETPGWSPDLVLNLFAEYTIFLGNGATLTPAIYFSYSDAYNTSNLYILDPNHDQDSYTKTDIRLTWRSADQQYIVAAYIENIEDEPVLSRGNNNSQDIVQTGYLYPQNYGVSFSMRF
ncbi:MAG: TonB-dependent receptor, partial [Gammaproteobacteria bacterium]|nr:TonB-dependent receptor [Gammaproteobacteria bacterium]